MVLLSLQRIEFKLRLVNESGASTQGLNFTKENWLNNKELGMSDWQLILIPAETKRRSGEELEAARRRIADYLSTALMNPDRLEMHVQECSRLSQTLRSTPDMADIDNLDLVAENGLAMLNFQQLSWLCFSVISLNALVECLWKRPLSLAWEQPLAQAYPVECEDFLS